MSFIHLFGSLNRRELNEIERSSLIWKLKRELKGTFIPLISLKNSIFLSSQNWVELEGTLIQFHSFYYLYSLDYNRRNARLFLINFLKLYF